MTRPNRVALVLIGLSVAASVAVAQTPPTDELVQDLRNQLKRLQDGKNELATENAKLRQQIADEAKKAAERLSTLQGRAYYLREHYAAWQQFLDQNPAVRTMWAAYFQNADTVDRTAELLGDGQWPFSIEG